MQKRTHSTDLSFSRDYVLDGAPIRVIANGGERVSRNHIEHTATLHERQRLARELHDGVLQSLTGAALQLEATAQLVDNDPRAVRERLHEIQYLIVESQRELRTWIESIKRDTYVSSASRDDLSTALQRLCCRVSRWGPQVELVGPNAGTIPTAFGDQVYRLVEESLSNITRHAHAHVACVEVQILQDRVRVLVEDDGCGFPFHGRYDLAALDARRQGPVSLKERIASLNGTLLLASTLSGSRLEMCFPFPQQAISRSLSTVRA